MSDWLQEHLTYDRIKELGTVIKEYTNNNRQVAYGVGAIACGLIAISYGPNVRHRIFAWINCQAMKMKDESYETLKKELFAPLSKIKSNDPERQKENSIKILEIGVGVGTNFTHYPDGSQLVVVDPNPYFRDYYNERRSEFPNIKAEEIIISMGEEMDMVPDNSVDAVIITLVLCSVNDVAKVVSQVKRVLAPDGKFFFMEHVHEWDRKQHGVRRFLQSLLTRTGFWPFVFDGCCLNRDPLPVIKSVGFSEVNAEYLYAPIPVALFKVCSPHLRGTATK